MRHRPPLEAVARRACALFLLFLILDFPVFADTTPHDLASGNFSQNWTTTTQITTNDNWSGVPSITGFRGDGLSSSAGTDPQTVTGNDSPGVIDVNANRNDPDTFGTGGVTEFDGIANPVVALAGSGTADAPYLQLYLNTTGRTTIVVSYNVRDVEASASDAVQQVALQYRVGASGSFTNLPLGFVSDATTGGAATLVTPVSVTLPPAAENQALVQVRIITNDSPGALGDEWVGIDDIAVTSLPAGPPPPTLNIDDVVLAEGTGGPPTTFQFTVSLTSPAPPGGVMFNIATQDGTAEDDNPPAEDEDYTPKMLLTQTIPATQTMYSFSVDVAPDPDNEANETFFVNVTNINGATPGDTTGQGTITNDDGAPTLNVNDVSMVEGASGTQFYQFNVTTSGPAGPGGVTFDVSTADDSATDADDDYEIASLTGQTIPAGSTGPVTLNVTVNGDNNPEPTEQFFVNVTNITGTGAVPGDTQGVGTIQTDDAPPDLTINNVQLAEGNSGTTTFTFTVTLSQPAPPGGVTFNIETAPDTALAGSDYVHKSLIAQTITSGNTTYQFDVDVNGDTVFEQGFFETFFVNVTTVSGANVVDGQGVGQIDNDDPAPQFTINTVSITEGNAGPQMMTLTITLTGARQDPCDVFVQTGEESSATVADNDYVANSTTLTFLPSDTTKTFDVTINGDTSAEGDEEFLVALSAPTGGAVILGVGLGLGVIRNDDPFSISAVDTPFLENFDVLRQITRATTPVGWTFSETGSSANLTYAGGTGSSNAGNTYSFGVAGTNPVTDRAFGGLQSGSLVPTIGAFYRNDTGQTITNLAIQYVGEEWRLGVAGRADRLDFQYSLDATSLSSGTWIDVESLDFVTPNQTAPTSAKDGNAAPNRQPRNAAITGLSIPAGATFWIRWTDLDISGAEDGLAVDDFSIIANFAGAFLSIDDVQAFEGNGGATNFMFTVSLSQPAPGPGGVTYDIATMDGSATDADNDYEIVNLTGQNIAAGNTSQQHTITVNGDLNVEPTEQFFVNVMNVANAIVSDGQGVGTIIDDDSPVTLIHTIQGSGAMSPIVGSSVTIRGIVTGVKSNGFFVQEEDADADTGPGSANTSEGIFVFTSSAPPAAAAFTSQVLVSGTVAEFVPSGDPQQPPSTELTSPVVVQLLPPGQPLPAAIPLTTTFPDPAGVFDQLEIVEHMRVSASSITVTGPSDGSFNETDATGTSNGRFHGLVTGVARPFREAGIQAPDMPPSGSIPPIPRWDFNPERLRIESATINAQPVLTVKSSDVVGPVVGPLDYSFRGYAIYPDGTNAIIVTPGTLPTMVTTPVANEFTVASFNLQRFFDNVDDAGVGDPVLTLTAYNNRLAKASIAIRNHLLGPDIIGVQEAEKIGVLNDLAAKILADGGPDYDAYLTEGNDVGGIDVGFLVKTDLVTGGVSRVSGVTVTQEGAATQWLDPSDNAMHTLNDRPPLVLTGTVNRTSTISFPIVVIVNHLRSLIGIDSNAPDGLTTEGDRVRQKRQKQAEFVANYVQGRLTSNPGEHIVVIGDFNAFEVNDGYTDVMNVLAGTPPPDNETVVPGDGVDLVAPDDLVTLVNTPPAAERYSYVHEGNGQNIDHALVSAGLVTDTTARRIEHPRIDADYPETERNNNATAFRISDHDPVVAFFATTSLGIADTSLTKTLNTSGPYVPGQSITWDLDVANAGPDTATNIQVTDTPTNATITNVSGSGCSSLPCTIASLNAGANTIITVTATIDSAGAFDNSADANGAESDPNAANNTDNTGNGGTAIAAADVSMTKTLNTSGPYFVGQSISYTLTVANAGASTATNINVTDTPSNLTITNVSGACTSFSPCTIASLAAGANAVINVTATIDSAGVFDNSATATGTEFDPNTSNNTDNVNNGGTTGNAADVSVVKSIVTPPPYKLGQTGVQWQIVVSNAGPSTATNVVVTDTPTGITITSVSGGGCTSFPCTIPSLAAGASVTIDMTATINTVGSFDNSATVSATEFDPNTTSNSDPFGNGGVSSNAVDLAITKTLDTSGPHVAGQAITYTLVVSNAGPGAAFMAEVNDTPTNLTITSVSGAGCTAFPCTLIPGILATPASNRTITITATINAAGPFDNVATVTTSSGDVENDPSNNIDDTGNGGTADGDSDGDGVLDSVEQAAPNGGDGNGDGIQDSQQGTVTSIPAATGSGYLTLQSSCQLQQVSVTTAGAMPAPDPAFNYPHGLIAFRAPCSSATFSLFVYGSGAVSVYRKFGPLPPGGPQQWYGIPATFTTATVGSLNPRRIDFSLTDGGTGDDTPVDGVIVDQGGPGGPTGGGAPTLSMWMLMLLAAMLAFVAARRL